jgi:Tfp pilus assembly protein PilF
MGRHTEAEEHFRQAVRILARVKRKDWGFLVIHANYGGFLVRQDKLHQAHEQYRAAYDLALALYGPDNKRTMNCAVDLAGQLFAEGRGYGRPQDLPGADIRL